MSHSNCHFFYTYRDEKVMVENGYIPWFKPIILSWNSCRVYAVFIFQSKDEECKTKRKLGTFKNSRLMDASFCYTYCSFMFTAYESNSSSSNGRNSSSTPCYQSIHMFSTLKTLHWMNKFWIRETIS